MRNQVTALHLNRVAAGALNPATPRADAAETHRKLRDGRLRLLYISKERLMQVDVLNGLARLGPARFAINHAHGISQRANSSSSSTWLAYLRLSRSGDSSSTAASRISASSRSAMLALVGGAT